MKSEDRLTSAVKSIVIYNYPTLQAYLSHLMIVLRQFDRSYTFADFSQDLGFTSSAATHLIVNGRRRVSQSQALVIAEKLGFKGKQKRYFLILAEQALCRSHEKRERLGDRLMLLKQEATESETSKAHIEFFSHWLHPIIFDLLSISGEEGADAQWLLKHILMPVKLNDILHSLEILEKIGCINQDPNTGKFKKVVQSFTAGDEVHGIGIIRYHSKMMELAQDSLLQVHPSLRDISAISVPVNEELAAEIIGMVREFRKFLLYRAESCSKPDRLMQINFQVFPVSK